MEMALINTEEFQKMHTAMLLAAILQIFYRRYNLLTVCNFSHFNLKSL